jgi:hypothetical protein
MKINNVQGWTEAFIDENCTNEKFYKVAGILHTTLGITFKNKIADLDSMYWDFVFNDAELTLHYNNYVGVSIFPRALINAVSVENKTVTELAQTLSEYLQGAE